MSLQASISSADFPRPSALPNDVIYRSRLNIESYCPPSLPLDPWITFPTPTQRLFLMMTQKLFRPIGSYRGTLKQRLNYGLYFQLVVMLLFLPASHLGFLIRLCACAYRGRRNFFLKLLKLLFSDC